jgi:hypothetical protein
MALRLATEACADESVFEPLAGPAGGIRVVERFRTRPLPGLVFTGLSQADGLPLRATRAKWDPAQGAADLHRRWREKTKDTAAVYPLAPPADPEARALWTAFSRDELGFVPRAGADLADRWRATLQRRYPSLDHLNRAWGTSFATWSEVSPPAELPQRPAALRDWIHFQGLVLPAQDAAHRFTVFLPQGSLGLVDREKRVDLVRRVVALEKPAHTAFDVRFYWAFFRVGEARLGEGTVVDLGSRSPELLSPFVLDRNYLGSGTLASEPAGRRTSSTCGCSPSSRGGDR